jgi:hypothetical protein
MNISHREMQVYAGRDNTLLSYCHYLHFFKIKQKYSKRKTGKMLLMSGIIDDNYTNISFQYKFTIVFVRIIFI